MFIIAKPLFEANRIAFLGWSIGERIIPFTDTHWFEVIIYCCWCL